MCDTFVEIDGDVKEVMRRLKEETMKCIKWFIDNLIQPDPFKIPVHTHGSKYIHKIILDMEGILLEPQ